MDEPSSSESETPSETTPEFSNEPSASLSSQSIRQKRYQEGRCWRVYRVQYELSESFEKSPITGVCDACAPGLMRTIEAFKALKHQGTSKKKTTPS